MSEHQCQYCQNPLTHIFADLGMCPPSNAFLKPEQCKEPEIYYPLIVYVCEQCLLVQVPQFKLAQEIFTPEYVYFSSYSKSWILHAREFVQKSAQRFALNENSFVLEVGSNDGYLLQHFVELKIPCLGIDPSVQAATEAENKGVRTITKFFTKALAQELQMQGKQADLLCGINVFAHVPDINNFITGIEIILASQGVMTMEIPHVLQLVQEAQFDTIYHEHYFYHSFFCVKKLLTKHGLRIFDVEELPTHGGSLRIYACKDKAWHKETEAVQTLLQKEETALMHTMDFYTSFQAKIDSIRFSLVRFLMQAKEEGKTVVGYGAAAKGNTLLNYSGIRADLLPFVVDASPYKQGLFLPGSHIPVYDEQMLQRVKPDYVLILPWNLKEEISQQLQYIRDWGGKFVTAVPQLSIRP